MQPFKNKHVIAALIITPILAIISYYAVDYAVSEKPHRAKAGATYPLVEKPNCRYSSGKCGLKNGDFELTLRTENSGAAGTILVLTAAHPLEGVKVAMVQEAGSLGPRDMQARDDSGLEWELNIPQPDPQQDRLQLAVASQQSLYYAETSLAFSHYETSFHKDFRSQP